MTNDTQYRAHGTIIGNNINKDFYKFVVFLNTAVSITIASRHEPRLVEYMKLRENLHRQPKLNSYKIHVRLYKVSCRL